MKRICTYFCKYLLAGCFYALAFGATTPRMQLYKNAYESFIKAQDAHDIQAAQVSFDTLAQLYITDENNLQLLQAVSQALHLASVHDFIEENFQQLRVIAEKIAEIQNLLKKYIHQKDDATKNIGRNHKTAWASIVNAQNAIDELTDIYNAFVEDNNGRAYIFKATTLDRILLNQLNSELDKIRGDTAQKIAQEYGARDIPAQIKRENEYALLAKDQPKVEKNIANLQQDVFYLAQAVRAFQDDTALNKAYGELFSEEDRKATAKLIEHLIQEHDTYIKANPPKEVNRKKR